MKPLIEVKNITYRHELPGQPTVRESEDVLPALDGISLQIYPGEFVAIIGSNGSGKTTLARHFNALLTPTEGSVTVAGLDTRQPENIPTIRRMVGMVFQYPEDQMVAATVEEDVAFGPENLGLPREEIRRRVDHALSLTGTTDLRKRAPYQLSAGQMQRTALAGVLAMEPDCIVFDESTAMLDPEGRRLLLEHILELHRSGLTVIYITHFMDEAALAERLLVLNNGRLVADGTPASVFSQTDKLDSWGVEPPPVALLANRLRAFFPNLPETILRPEDLIAALPEYPSATLPAENAVPPDTADDDHDPIKVEVNDVSYRYALGTPFEQSALNGVSLSIEENSIHGLVGATGSGKTTLLQHLNGLLLPQTGAVRVGPYNLGTKDVDLKAVRRLAGLLFQIPEYQLFETYVGDEIAYGPRRMGLTGEELRERVRTAMELVGLPFEEFKDRLTFSLSGGERRKVTLASVLALDPEILLLDEPTAGLDPKSRREFLNQLFEFQSNGKTIVVSSHRMEDIGELSESVSVLSRGNLLESASTASVFSQPDVVDAAGLGLPLTARIAIELRKRGWPIRTDLVRSDDLIASMESLARGVYE